MKSSSLLLFPTEGLTTERLLVRPVRIADAAALCDFYDQNRAHLEPWEPLRAPDFYDPAATEVRLVETVSNMEEGRELRLALLDRQNGELVGICGFSNIVRGVFQACHLGFAISARAQGKGIMKEALRLAIDAVFARYDMHRIMANHRPENLRSARLLQSLGFEREGLARSYLKINGEWADHVLTSLLNPAH